MEQRLPGCAVCENAAIAAEALWHTDAVKRLGKRVTAGLVAAAVLFATALGWTDDLPDWSRALLQGLGTVAGIYLGVVWQQAEQKSQLEAVGDSAVMHLTATARSLLTILEYVGEARAGISTSAKSIASVQTQADAVLGGVSAQVRGILHQTEAAATTWRPYSPNFKSITTSANGQLIDVPSNQGSMEP